MDNRRFVLFMVISVAILTIWRYMGPHPAPLPIAPHPTAAIGTPAPTTPNGTGGPVIDSHAPRVAIDAPRLSGSISLTGARLDDIKLRNYHETVDPQSPLVRLLSPSDQQAPSYVQFGWNGDGVKVPALDTVFTADHDKLTQTQPVTLSWDNGNGQTFAVTFSIDANYMFHVQQTVHNTGGKDIALYPWARMRRDYTAPVPGNVFEGMLGVSNGRLSNLAFKQSATKADSNGVAAHYDGTDGWAGFTDKYWLTALIPDQGQAMATDWDHFGDTGNDHYQVGYITDQPIKIAAGQDGSFRMQLFTGAKEVALLNQYENTHIPLFSYAIDWGKFYLITRPFMGVINFLNQLTGNFGVAILLFTVSVKLLLYPLAASSFRSMAKMKILTPKMQEIKERYKDDPAAQQKAIMDMYRAEKINPAGGCLPMVIQIPILISLYNVILINIGMRHAPFFLWIHDLSAQDPTNVFNLFGLLPFDPSIYSHYLHLGVFPLIMGTTMWLQQRLNPAPQDPVQAQMFQYMPIIFTFMLGYQPAGLVIYWTWNNLLTMVQQLIIQRQTQTAK